MIAQFLTHPHFYEAIGMMGFGFYVLNYGLLSLGLMSGDAIAYFAMNLVAATCVMIGLTYSFNLASALIQGFWIAMSVIAIVTRVIRMERITRQNRKQTGPQPAFT